MRALKQLHFSVYTFHASIAGSCDGNTFFFESYHSVSVKYARRQKLIYATYALNMPQI